MIVLPKELDLEWRWINIPRLYSVSYLLGCIRLETFQDSQSHNLKKFIYIQRIIHY